MKRKALAAIMAVAMAVSMAGCGGSTSESKDSTQKTETADSTASTGGSVENKDKPLCWFNRQPSSSATGELDKDALNFNGNTYYVGFDANQGAELQGQMVLDYIKKNVLYLEAGVKEYWIVNPIKEWVTVYRYEEDVAPTNYTFTQPITVGIYKNLTITIADLLN